MGFGDYPPEYDAKRHGPYDPARYYGKPDIPFSYVRLSELPAWLSRRRMGPQPLAAMVSRAWWRWNHKHVLPRQGGFAPVFHLLAGSCLIFYVIDYGKISKSCDIIDIVVHPVTLNQLFKSTTEITNIIRRLEAVS